MEDELTKSAISTLRTKYRKEIAQIRGGILSSLTIDYTTILNNRLAELIIRKKHLADICFVDAFKELGVEPLTVRYINLPTTPIRNLKSEFVGQTRSFEGIVRRVSEVKSKATLAVFECSYCSTRVSKPQGNDTTYPESKCDNCGKIAKWRVLADQGEYIDYQQITVQEFPESIRGSDQPKSITITITGDLCGVVTPGNRATICGTLKLKKIKGDNGLIFEPYIDGNSIVIKDETYDNITISDEDLSEITALSKTPNLIDLFASSIAPTVYGNDDVKRGITLQLFGGVPKTIAGTRIRGDIHVLLIGDPSTAKSVLCKSAVALVPRGIFTHAYSTSKAGLTATAVKEDEHWVLEAGALVLANGGGLGVDELDKMTTEDREALHGAMEQQEINIAKAGIVAKLYTRCFLLGAANPKLGRFDLCQGLAQQFDLAPTLLSRFDLIYPMTDTPEPKRDSDIADYILNTHTTQKVKETVPSEMFRKYVSHARSINPQLTKEAAAVIKDYYIKVRGLANNMATIPITARSLEALIRMSEAAARMRLSETITVDDATLVVSVVDTCLRQIAYDSKTGSWDVDKVINRYPKRTANIIGRLTDTIISLGDTHGAEVSNVVKHMKEMYGVAEEDTLSHIELMKNETRVFSPKTGYLKVLK